MDSRNRRNKYVKSHGIMNTATKEFLQKICYKESASVDMTKYGFIKDSKVYSIKVYIEPLSLQLEKICGKSEPSIPPKKIVKKVRLMNRKCKEKVSVAEKKKKIEKRT